MLSASSCLKQVAALRWKSPKFFCLSFLLCSFESDLRFNRLHGSISQILNTKHMVTFKTPSIHDDEVAYQILDEIGLELQKSPKSINHLCTNHITELCKNRKLGTAARLLQLLRDQLAVKALQPYNLLLAAACETNDTKTATTVFKDMLVNHLPLNSTTFFNVAKAISMSNDFTLVPSFVKEVSELTSANPTVIINRIIYAFAECGHVHNSLLVFDHIKSFELKPDLVTYNTVLGILGKAGRVDEMLDVFASMKKVDVEPDMFTYNTLLHSLRRVGRLDLCVEFIKEMVKVGLQPDLITYTALIECFFKSGNVEESLKLFQHMKSGDVCPSVYIYRSLVNNLRKLGKEELALMFLKEMNERGEDLVGPKDFKRKNK